MSRYVSVLAYAEAWIDVKEEDCIAATLLFSERNSFMPSICF